MSDPNIRAIILFDGVCNFCNHTVQFIIKHDRKGYFHFAPVQSNVGEAWLEQRPDLRELDTVFLIEDGEIYVQSTAVLRIAKNLDGAWKAASILLIIPKSIRDLVYRWFARHRYRWFGKDESCMMPTPDIKARFLND